jgi:hypothetical protein
MDAVNPIDKLNAAKRVQQRLRKDPNDIEALLQLAVMLGALKEPDLDQKRKVLHRVLSLEPASPRARQMLFEMDRAAIGGDVSRLSAAAILTDPLPSEVFEKPLILRYSIAHQLLVYLLIALTMFIGLSVARDPEVLAVVGAFLVFLLIPLWFVSVVIEIDNSGLNISRLFGIVRAEIAWNDIKEFKSSAMGQGVMIITHDGNVVEVSAQINGYPFIIEILRQRRPDLFRTADVLTVENAAQDSSTVPIAGSSAGRKTFQKSFLAKYGPFVLLVLGCLIFLGTVINAQCLVAIPMGLILFLLWKFALHTPYLLSIEENKLSTQSFRKKLDLTPQQIKDIRMQVTYHYKHPLHARRHIEVELFDGNSFRLAGFAEGDEILYSFLKNWWSACQNT